MLKANKSIWFEKIFSIYNRNLIKRKFHSLKVLGIENLQKKNPKIPLIIYANHSSWWDGLIIFQLFQKFDFDTYVMMEEKQLKDLKLFLKLGAFSVIRDNPREALKSINYAADILRSNPNANLWIFPQGEILPNDSRPIIFYNGLSRLLQKTGKCSIVGIALRYEFLNEFKPEIFIMIGDLELFDKNSNFSPNTLATNLADNLTSLLDELKEDVIKNKTELYLNLI